MGVCRESKKQMVIITMAQYANENRLFSETYWNNLLLNKQNATRTQQQHCRFGAFVTGNTDKMYEVRSILSRS